MFSGLTTAVLDEEDHADIVRCSGLDDLPTSDLVHGDPCNDSADSENVHHDGYDERPLLMFGSELDTHHKRHTCKTEETAKEQN